MRTPVCVRTTGKDISLMGGIRSVILRALRTEAMNESPFFKGPVCVLVRVQVQEAI